MAQKGGSAHALKPAAKKPGLRGSGPRLPAWLPWLFGGLSLTSLILCWLAFLILLAVSASLNVYLAWQLSGVEILIRKRLPETTPVVMVAATATPWPTATPLPAATPTPAAPPPTPHPMAAYTIEGLKSRPYSGGAIQVRSLLTTTQVFTRYYIDYPSDGLTITGILQVPPGKGPFPVIILNHGFIPPHSYWSGADTWSAAEYLNRRGYLTIASDFRNWGQSDNGNSFFRTGPVIDALNLISSLPSIPQADPERVGMWGHSMGGGVTTKAITIDPRIKAAVLYAPLSANDAEVLARWGPGCGVTQAHGLAQICSEAEVLAADIDEALFLAYSDAIYNPQVLYQTSPMNYFNFVTAPVQIHIGTADTSTPPEWSIAIYQALLASGKEAELFTYPEQGHALKGESWRLFMERTTDFFDRHLLYPAQVSN